MLELREVTAGYGESDVLRSLSARWESGRVHGIVGRNAEGKTTLLRVVSGQHRPIRGSVLWSGRGATLASRATAFLPVEPFFYPWITAREHLEMCRPAGSTFDPAAWCELLELPVDRAADTLSSGMRRRLALLACIALERPLLALDEPFNNLDAESSHLVAGMLRRLVAGGRTVLVTSHVPGSLESVCDRIHWLHQGVIEASFQPVEFPAIGPRVFGEVHDELFAKMEAWLARKADRAS